MMMQHKAKLQNYFNGVGFQRWVAIYGGQANVSRVRRTIREGHAAMLAQAEAWLLADNLPAGTTLLDAGCGTGLFSLAMARQGFNVTGIDLAAQMVEAARAQAQQAGLQSKARFAVGDLETMTDTFDAVACFDVLIHYAQPDFAQMLTKLAQRTCGPLLFTYAPSTPLLATLHWVGGRFPASDRRTAIQMISAKAVGQALAANGFGIQRTAKITRGFYNVTLVEATRR